MPKVTLRQAHPADIPKLVALLNLCYRGDPTGKLVGWTDERELVGGIRTTPDELAQVIADPNQYLFVYPKSGSADMGQDEQTGELLGSISVGFGCGDGEKSENTAIIGTFCVHPSLQGQGIGDTILNAAETFAARHLTGRLSSSSQVDCTIKMYILAHRPKLLAFYERRGYALTGNAEPFPIGGNNGEPKRDDLALLELKKSALNV